MFTVRLAGTRLGTDEWGVWDTEKNDFVRDNGIVRAYTDIQYAEDEADRLEAQRKREFRKPILLKRGFRERWRASGK